MDFGKVHKLWANKQIVADKNGTTFIQNHALNLKI